MNKTIAFLLTKGYKLVEEDGIFVLQSKRGTISNGHDIKISFYEVDEVDEEDGINQHYLFFRIKGSQWVFDGWNVEYENSFNITVKEEKLFDTLKVLIGIDYKK